MVAAVVYLDTEAAPVRDTGVVPVERGDQGALGIITLALCVAGAAAGRTIAEADQTGMDALGGNFKSLGVIHENLGAGAVVDDAKFVKAAGGQRKAFGRAVGDFQAVRQQAEVGAGGDETGLGARAVDLDLCFEYDAAVVVFDRIEGELAAAEITVRGCQR